MRVYTSPCNVSQILLIEIQKLCAVRGSTIIKEKGSKGKSVLLFQTIDSVVTNDSLQALVRQFYGLTIAYDEVTYTHQ